MKQLPNEQHKTPKIQRGDSAANASLAEGNLPSINPWAMRRLGGSIELYRNPAQPSPAFAFVSRPTFAVPLNISTEP